MALFPAYNPTTSNNYKNDGLTSKSTDKNEANRNIPDFSWLQNTSFISIQNQDEVKSNIISRSSDGSTDNEVIDDIELSHKKQKLTKSRSRPKHKKKKSVKAEKCIEIQEKIDNLNGHEDDGLFYEDKKQEKGNFLVSTLYRPAVPRYKKDNCYFKEYSYLMKNYKENKYKSRRYFRTSGKKITVEDSNSVGGVKEEELTRVTEQFNKRLAANPQDICGWLEYVNYQETIFDFEKAYRNNPVGGEKVTTERKLAILEKALKSNPASDKLLEEKLALCERVKPADQMANECLQELARDPGNLTLWRALVRTTRNSVARCTVPGVLQLYSRAVTRISQLRMYRPPLSVENDILGLLMDCGLFLQQAGLWEQLWTLLQMYLSVALTASGHFDVPFIPPEEKLKEDEDRVCTSGLPLSVLWTRVEKLRAAAHFLPEPHCVSDPQRVVFTDDLAGLVAPVMCPELRLTLVVTVAVLLKVPLIPSRHCLLSTLGLLHSPVSLDSTEALLPAASNPFHHCRWLHGLSQLLGEPQYVLAEPYLDWVVSVLHQCAELLPLAHAVHIHCWLLRLYGLLCRLSLLGLATVPQCVRKKAKAHAKKLLKSPQLRDNLILFVEYALVERDMGEMGKACQVLETAASMAPPQSEPSVDYVSLCRRLAECLLLKDFAAEKERAVGVLVSLGESQPVSTEAISDVSVRRGLAQWQRRTSSLASSLQPLATTTLTVPLALTPQLLVEWLGCHALLLSLTVSVTSAHDLLLHHIDLLPTCPGTLGWLWVEQLYEALVEILYCHSLRTHTGFSSLRQVLKRGLGSYPSNLFLLTTTASLETGDGGGGSVPWRLSGYFPPSSPLACAVLVLVVRFRVSQHITGKEYAADAASPYLRNVLARLISHPVTAQCPLVWRLYLQFVAASGSAANIKQAFYRCVNACPWVKSLYTDAVEFLPEEMPEILDLIIEKELRLHTTPEELEILRD